MQFYLLLVLLLLVLKCIILLDNFRGANIPKLAFPVILRQLTIEAKCDLKHIIKMSLEFPSWINNSKPNHTAQLMEKEPLLRPIDFIHHAGTSKPWNCQFTYISSTSRASL